MDQEITPETMAAQIKALALSPEATKAFMGELVRKTWTELPEGKGLPSFSTLDAPVIEELQKATVGTGAVMVFKEHGIDYAVIVKPGTHYQNARYDADPAKPKYMTAGGFINLSEKPKTELTAANPSRAETPREGAAREIEEEIVDDKKRPVLQVDPERLKPIDTKTITFPWGERRVVIGFVLELTPHEVNRIKAHVQRLENDTEYRHAVRAHTINDATGKPEICTVSILPLREVTKEEFGKEKLLHPDQQSLFRLIENTLDSAGRAR